MAKTTIRGLDKLNRKLARLPADIRRAAVQAVQEETEETGDDMRRLAPVLTGELANSVQEIYLKGRLSSIVTPQARYAKYVNNGARGVAAQPFATAAGKLARKRFPVRTRAITRAALQRLAKVR